MHIMSFASYFCSEKTLELQKKKVPIPCPNSVITSESKEARSGKGQIDFNRIRLLKYMHIESKESIILVICKVSHIRIARRVTNI